MFLSIRRIIRFGWTGFCRNSGLSIATIFILVLTISLATSLFLMQNISQHLIAELQEKVDISVYFNKECPEERVLKIKEQLETIPEVRRVEYISAEEALAAFVERHKDDLVLMESLQEVGVNPFFAALNIKAKEAAQYGTISSFLDTEQFQDVISDVDYYEKKAVIEKLFSFTNQINRIGLILSGILAVVAVSLVFNQVKLAINNKKEEIEVMKLVGSSNWFARGPFIVQGFIAGVISAVATCLLFLAITFFLSPKIEAFIPSFNIFQYFIAHILIIFLIQLAIGTGLGVISSVIAIRKYLKV
ncbi:ABC transporter permease [Candidatus Parcubacteria bacterium]|nr:ABC transporter permease [Candidatus Parcubacteria bacterium]